MKITEKRTVDVITKYLCDVCDTVFEVPEGYNSTENLGQLNAHWGYGSTQDGSRYHLDLCEKCYRLLKTIVEAALCLLTKKLCPMITLD